MLRACTILKWFGCLRLNVMLQHESECVPASGQLLIKRTQVVFLHCTDSKDLVGIYPSTYDLDPDLPALDQPIACTDEFGRVAFGLELVLDWYQVARDKDIQRTDFGEEAHLVDVGDFCIHHFPFKRFQHDGLVGRVELGESRSGNHFALTNVDQTNHFDDVAVFACTSAFDVITKFLVEKLDHRRSEVRRMELGLVCEVLEEEHVVREQL